MRKNVGGVDRVIRVIVAIALMYIGFFPNPIVSGGMFRIVIGIVGGFVLLAALVGVCPLYVMADINTTKDEEDAPQ
jgi:hypothetical protein